MKKINISVAAILLAGSMLCSSCIGSFGLLNSYANWQKNMTGNKFVNGIVGLILTFPVGGFCFLADAIVLNTIEFWSGSNPVMAGTTTTVKGQDGRYYAVKVLKNGYEVKAPTGEVTLFLHDSQNDSWSMEQNGVKKEIFRFNQDGTIQASLQNGETMTVACNEEGLQQLNERVLGSQDFFAQR
jgi:hypothetical protein